MKKDLRKWLKKNSFEHLSTLPWEERSGENEMDEDDFIEFIEDMEESNGKLDTVQLIWCAGQKQFLKDILDDIDDMIDKLFNGNDVVKNDKAKHVAEEAQLKAWLYNKYKYLQRKNGK